MTHLGQLLNLPDFHHFYPLQVRLLADSPAEDQEFIIAFTEEETPVFIDLDQAIGYSNSPLQAQRFYIENLLLGLTAVPLHAVAAAKILEVPPVNRPRGVQPSVLAATYSDIPEFASLYPRHEQTQSVYDPYRYAYTIEEKKVAPLESIDRKEYEHIKDFHPFLQTARGNVYAVPCYFQDSKRQQTVKLYVMGWYFYDQQLKISWKPSHSRKSRWRSSIVAIDKRTDRYFFQGELYKKGTYPIFFDSLEPRHASYQGVIDREFKAFLDIVAEQKRKARLRLR